MIGGYRGKKKKKEYFFEETDERGPTYDHKKIFKMHVTNSVVCKILVL